MNIEYEALAVASATVATSAGHFTRIQGYFNGAADRWLQLHDAKVLPANGAVPLRVWPLYATAPFDQNFQNDGVTFANGCVFAVSSTQATLTASADTMDVYVNGEQAQDVSDVSIAGDYSTDDEVLQVWADSAGPKKLVRLEASDEGIDSGGVYVQIHAADTPATDKIVASFLLTNGGTIDKSFGDGLVPFRKDGATRYDGCTIAVSLVQNAYDPAGFDINYIRATYKAA